MSSAIQHERQFFLDWVRIIAFFLLILYHVGMYYVSWDWHVKSPSAGKAIEPLMFLTSPWRLGLLFLVSGVASGLMLHKTGTGNFVGRRTLRLLLPLVFGMFVIVPPQAYLEVVEKLAYAGNYLSFMQLYVTSYKGFCRGDDCLDMPTWNHLWFVAYLWVYTLVLWALFRLGIGRFSGFADRVVDQLTGWRLILLPAAFLAIIRLSLLSYFPPENDLINDWYNHALYLSLFLFGAMLAVRPSVWDEAAKLRWFSLGVALLGWTMLVIYFGFFSDTNVPLDWQRLSQRGVYALTAWCAMLAACGFARLHLQKDGPARRYLTQAIFPVYILHQTLTVCFAFALKPVGLAPPVEGLVLVVLTLGVSFFGFEVIRRVRLLRPLFGLAIKA